MDDYVTFGLLASSAFFVALSIGLLFRYRQVSNRITASSDLGRDLWQALDQRLRKQDERILDVLGRLEVVQARLANAPSVVPPSALSTNASKVAQEPKSDTNNVPDIGVTASSPVAQTAKSLIDLDDTQVGAIRLLGSSQMSTIEIKTALGRSREHTARLMKGLFDQGLVSRDDSQKPFVYNLTEEGRRYLPDN